MHGKQALPAAHTQPLMPQRAAPSLPRQCPSMMVGQGSAAPLHVLLCADAAYLRHAAVAALSAAEASARPISFHVFTSDRDEKEEDRLRRTLHTRAETSLEFHRVPAASLAGLRSNGHVTVDAFLRFLAPDLLPPNVRRVVYLDSDVVVLDDLAKLCDLDLKGKAVAAAPDCDWTGANPDGRLARLGIGPPHVYVNSGVLVMDLDRWRRDGLRQALFDFVRRRGQDLVYVDQDALNIVLKDDVTLLDRRWNLQAMLYSRSIRRLLPVEWVHSAAARREPGIVHFTTSRKPWHLSTFVPQRRLYLRYSARTAWRGEPLAASDAARRAYAVRHALLRAGVDTALISAAIGRLTAAINLGR